MHYYETNSNDPSYNLAFEEYLLNNKLEDDILILWQNDKSVIIGRNQITREEINTNFVKENHIKVIRRNTGGGAVYHDLGNLNYSFITDRDENISWEKFARPIVNFLRNLGLDAETSGRNDILINKKKVSGVAQRIEKKRILYHGTLLFDANLEFASKALAPDNLKFISKSTKSVRSRITNIRSELKTDMTLNTFWTLIKKELCGEAIVLSMLKDFELEKIRELQTKKYLTWEWNYGEEPQGNFHNKKRFNCGTIEIYATLAKGLIKKIGFTGDFLSKENINDISDSLVEVKFLESDIKEKLLSFNLNDYFGEISLEEILSLFK